MPPGRAITLQDIADRLGLTPSTVSYAITGRGRVSDQTRRRVLDTARELGYQPNTLARRLRGARTGIVALRLPRYTTTMSYYMEATFGVAEEAERAGMTVSLLTTSAGFPASPDNLHADGLILLDPDADDLAARALLHGSLPVITGELTPPGLPPGGGAVASDHATAVAALMDHLAECGARRPALLIPDLRSHWVISVRTAFEEWCTRHGVAARTSIIPHPTTPEDVGRSVADVLSDGTDGADAIVAGSDGIVLNVITSAERSGRQVGTDLLVATVVDSDVLRFTRPTVTAIDLHPREFGRRCVRTLLTLLAAEVGEKPAEFLQETVSIELHRRESTLGVAAPPAIVESSPQ